MVLQSTGDKLQVQQASWYVTKLLQMELIFFLIMIFSEKETAVLVSGWTLHTPFLL